MLCISEVFYRACTQTIQTPLAWETCMWSSYSRMVSIDVKFIFQKAPQVVILLHAQDVSTGQFRTVL